MTVPPVADDRCATAPPVWQSASPGVAPSPALRGVTLAITALVLALFALAAIVPVGGAVIASGQIITATGVKRVVHPTGGVIGQMLVHNGDHVRAGQVLLRFDSTVTGSDAALTALSVEQLLAQKARASAEQLGLRAVVFPPELATVATPGARQAMADERRLFALHQREQGGIGAQLAARMAQDQAAIGGLQIEIAALRAQHRLIEHEQAGVRELWAKQLVTISRMNQLDRSMADLDGSIGALQARIAEARAQIAEARQQAIQLTQGQRAAAGAELNQINAALNQQQLRRVAARDSRDRADVRAPSAGTVEKIAFAGIGDVIRPAEPIMELVPNHDAMVVETMVSPTAIDRVHIGDQARIRLSRLNRAATPDLPGRVVYIASDRSENAATRTAWYVVHIAFDPAAAAREAIALKSGMPAEVHVITGSRSLLSYVLKPLRDQFSRAFGDT